MMGKSMPTIIMDD